MTAPITIDGSLGEGGGQILRTSLALSMLTGKPFRIENIRAGRAKPGLLRQHLTAVHAAMTICTAAVEGAAIGSQSLTFKPGKVKPGDYSFSIGTAGSTTLVLQAILPALLTAPGPSTLTLEGGTHNPHAPPFDFLAKAFIPLINRMGPTVEITLDRPGFYPAGGGRLRAAISPAANLAPLQLTERGPIQRRLATAYVAALPGEIAKRELAQVEKRLGWTGDQLQIRQLPAHTGPGNIITLEITSEHITELFTGFGEKGISAEAVADQAIESARQYLACGVPIGPCLADQLLLPLALAGKGEFVTSTPTQHTSTNAAVIAQFLEVKIDISHIDGDRWRIGILR